MLKYGADHARNGDPVEPRGIALIMYDTRNKGVVHMQDYEITTDMIEIHADYINAIEAHGSTYSKDVWAVVQASEEAKQRKRQGQPILDPQTGFSLIGRMSNRLEDGFRRLAEWKGNCDFSVMLPYAELHKGGMNRPDDEIDLAQTKPYLNGVIFTLRPFTQAMLPSLKANIE